MILSQMSIDELQSHIDLLQSKIDKIEKYSDEAKSKYGEKALERKRDDLRVTQSCYYRIDTSNHHAILQLARIQGIEQEIKEDIALLENAPKQKEVLDAEILKCIDMLNERKKSSTSERR
jgi:hypothetical protein